MFLVQPDLDNLLAFKMKAAVTNIYPSFAVLPLSTLQVASLFFTVKYFVFQAMLNSSVSKDLIAIFIYGFLPLYRGGQSPLALLTTVSDWKQKEKTPKFLECDQRSFLPMAAKIPTALGVFVFMLPFLYT